MVDGEQDFRDGVAQVLGGGRRLRGRLLEVVDGVAPYWAV
jgi:hypothetical protein